jgi:NosR/NirI family transcriptional regulator, nitrous oxide reductase regulator
MSAEQNQFRFPQPDFSSGYRYPEPVLPGPEWVLWPYVDLAVLAAILAFTALAFYRWRSRLASALCALAGFLWFGIFRQGCPCPVGGVQDTIAFFVNPEAAIDVCALAFFFVPIAVALFRGRLYCGGACPLGAAQELAFLRRIPIPAPVERALGVVPVFMLGTLVAGAITAGPNIACAYDPFLPVFHPGGISGRWLLSAGFIVASLGVYRPYCRFLCPYGLILKGASLFATRKCDISPDVCLDCGVCADSCPAGVIERGDGQFDTEEGRGNLASLAVASVFIVAALSVFGYFLGRGLSMAHPDVSLAALFARGDEEALSVRAFIERGGNVAELTASARQIASRFSAILAVTGALAGLKLALSLALEESRRGRRERAIKTGSCFVCSRCYRACPRDRHSREVRKESL